MGPLFFPLAILGSGLGAAAYVHAKNSPHGKIMSVLDAHMPAALRKLVAQSVVAPVADPKKLATLAQKLQPSYPIAAAVVATRVIQVATPAQMTAQGLGGKSNESMKGVAIAPKYNQAPSTGVVDPLHLVSDGTADLDDVTNAVHQFDLSADLDDGMSPMRDE